MSLTFDNSADWQYADGLQNFSLQRKTTAKTAGVAADTWTAIVTQLGVPGSLQPSTGRVQSRFMELGLVVPFTIFFSRDIGARASDRLSLDGTGRLFQVVEGGYEAGYFLLTGFPAAAHVQEIATSP